MSRLIRSGLSCKWCPSSDGLAQYENGYYCFSCKKTQFKQEEKKQFVVSTEEALVKFPPNTEITLPTKARALLYKYHFTDRDIATCGFTFHEDCPIWSKRLDKYISTGPRILMPQYISEDGDIRLLFWEGKALDKNTQIKSLSCGGAGQYFTTRVQGKSTKLVIVEDILSAWRINLATGIDCLALRGTNVRINDIVHKHIQLPRLGEDIRIELAIWMDNDLAGHRAARKLETLGYYGKVKPIKTKQDPKTYSPENIRDILYY